MAKGKSGGAPSVDLAAVGKGEWIKSLIVRGKDIPAGPLRIRGVDVAANAATSGFEGIAKSPAARSGNQKGPVRTDGVFASGGRPLQTP